MDRYILLSKLPPFKGKATMIQARQTVGDIISETIDSHKFFAKDYDSISDYFDHGTTERTLREMFNFLKMNVRYREEPEHRQTSKSPSAILATATGDCKHYALFISGILDSLNRKGRKFDWVYRFASYSEADSDPGHVFIVVRLDGGEIWVDPVLNSFDSRKIVPASFKDKKSVAMPLYRISGVPEFAVVEDEIDASMPPELVAALRKLLYYGVMNTRGQINDRLLVSLQKKLSLEDFTDLVNARKYIHSASMAGLFGDIWSGVKTVTLAIPRNAYLSLVGVNAFGLATKLLQVIQTGDNWKKVWAKWESLGGRPSALENTIIEGAKKKAILGAAPAIPAWVAAASAIIAAIAPIIKEVLGNQENLPTGAGTSYPYGICEDGITPRGADGSCPATGTNDNFFSKNWPYLVGGGLLLYFLMKPKRA